MASTLIAAIVLTLSSVTSPVQAEGVIKQAGDPNAIPGSYIVVYKEAPAAGLTAALAGKHGASVTHTYDAALNGFAARMSEQEAKRLAADPAVDYVQANHVFSIDATQPNPPSWGLDRVDQRNRPLNNAYTYDTTASNVHAYVIDTGIRTSHTDFGGRAVWNFNGIDSNNTDCNGHGTHVAGTVGGSAYGVAKAVRLHAVKVLDCGGFGTTASVLAGVNWVTSNRVNPAVANMSIGGPADTAIDNAVRNSIISGVTYAVAAGNNNGRNACNYSPSRVTQAIVVGASTINDGKPGFSNIGGCLDLFAPGENITSAWSTSDTASNTISGTSMATPHVAGVVALYLSGNPGASPAMARDTVVYNSTVNRLSGIGSGSPNVLLHSRFIAPGPGTNVLTTNQSMASGQSIRSNVGNHILVMQVDGNLVQYQEGVALWHTGTWGNNGAFCVLQSDGNFVIYRANGTPIWATNTSGTPANLLAMQDDGNVVLYGPGGAVYWHK